MPALSTTEFDFISSHLDSRPKKNMHNRQSRTVKKISEMHYCNVVKRISARKISCHLSGPNTEVRFDVFLNASDNPEVAILHHSFANLPSAIEFVNKELRRLNKRANQEHFNPNKFPPDYKKGRFYIQRNNTGRAAPAAHAKAINNGSFSQAFGQSVTKWDFQIIEGHG